MVTPRAGLTGTDSRNATQTAHPLGLHCFHELLRGFLEQVDFLERVGYGQLVVS